MFTKKIILASQSPRRKQILDWAEIECEIIVSETDESYPPDLGFEDTAIHIARNKALAVVDKIGQGIPVLAADTIVVCDELIIGKPTGRENAIQILKNLSGKQHKVITGVVILVDQKEICFSDTTLVSFHSLTEDQITFYVDKYKPFDKAGAYAIQEWIGVTGIKCIEGDFYNVMGLPVSRLIQELNLL